MKKQKKAMKSKKTNLSKILHVYRNYDDILKHFAHDVATMGKEFSEIANTQFDLKNPWDQGVMVAIFTNMLACVVVNAELTGDDIKEFVKNFYNDNLEEYRRMAKEQGMRSLRGVKTE